MAKTPRMIVEKDGKTKKRGRKKTEHGRKIDELLEKHKGKIFFGGKLAKSISQIYIDISKELNIRSPQMVYLQARRYFGLDGMTSKYDCDDCETFEESQDYDQTFTLRIDEIDIIKQFLETQVYIRGVRSFLRLIIWNFSKYTCTWQFDVCAVRQNELVCTGTCNDRKCGAKVFISTEQERSILRITLKNFNDGIVHESVNTYMTGEHKDRISKVLRDNTPYVTRSLLAADMLEECDMVPGVLPKKSALRDLKCRMKIKENKPRLDSDPVFAVAKMASIERKVFDHVAIHPFVVMYATEMQSMLVRLQKKVGRIIIAIDASGVSLLLSPVADVSDRTGKLKRCFLYVITLQRSGERALPIYQMLSQDHTTIQINMMIQKCRKRCNDFMPDEIIMDDSAALLLSAVNCFTEFISVHKYMDYCYDIMRNKDASKATAYIRLDRSHVVKSIKQRVAIKKGVNKTAVTFYQRILGFLIQETDIEICEQIIRKMFVVMKNMYIHSTDIRETINELERLAAQHKIDKDVCSSNEYLPNDNAVDEVDLNRNEPKNKFLAWTLEIVSDIANEVKNRTSEEMHAVNPYFADGLEKDVIHFVSRLPLCGNIMNIPMGSTNTVPSSSSTETDFDLIKNDLFKKSRGIRPDTFLEKHIIFTKGRIIGQNPIELKALLFEDQSDDMLFKNSDLPNFQKNETVEDESAHESLLETSTLQSSEINTAEFDSSDESYDSFDEKLNKVESWGGYNEDGVKKNKKLHRSKTTILEPIRRPNQKVPLLKNGHVSTSGKPRLSTVNTCLFDAIYSVNAVSYADYPSIEHEINEYAKPGTFEELIRLLFAAKENVILNKRNILLEHFYADDSAFARNITKDLIEIDCECAFDYLHRKIFDASQSLYSLRELNVCFPCNNKQNERFLRFMPLAGSSLDLKNLQQSIQPLRATRQKCKCGEPLSKQRKANNVITFDADGGIPDVNRIHDVMHTKLPYCSIDELTQTVNVDGKEYHLYAVICYTYSPKHFYAKVKRPNGNWELYDDLARSVKQVKTHTKDYIQVIHYISGKIKLSRFVY